MQRLRYSRYFKSTFITLDIVVLSVVFIYLFWRKTDFNENDGISELNIISLIILISFWILLSGRTKLYSIPRNLTFTIYLERIITHIFLFIVGVILLAKVSNNPFLKEDRFQVGVSLFVSLSIIKSISFFTLKYLRTFGFNHRNIMFLSENDSTDYLKSVLIERKDYGFKFFNFKENPTVENLEKFWKTNGIHTLILPSENSEIDKNLESEIFNAAEKNKVLISLVPNIIQNAFLKYELEYVGMQPILTQFKFPLDYLTNYLIKRVFDILFSLIFLLVIGLWLFPLIALLIKSQGKGSAIFKQKRYGYHDKIFTCLKFRTMKINNSCDEKTTSIDDKRITSIGKFLRRTSLDETPQFINVLKGEMSIIGPRPHMLLVDDHFKQKIIRYSLRSHVKPGISGLAQVNGLRGDGENIDFEMQKRILSDSFYVKNWTLSLDLVIALKTILLLIKGDKNAH
ncbi:exopolysaccharide biosynthesis polyprenyl glycosylphosphotransferase [Halpernia frigidisoli]|uniref:Putative colanic acid biosysnthesis UDP-glucose lipid carrier transferase n=1 Tax=Halpernia frigidisoli TaxID=1125876 RepID=A0A1I3I0X4_9FLAO|nr:exopolysaccharide biosynthesis polyprenyl glycosylphosphotransferase [Halpernia frigidisoli]SFI41665.1 putative colanic acid biosysnthesis UDP-glucose lipid carrier transferase [Halpernia frigidisoli]